MKQRYIAVVGAVNVDIWGRAFAPLIARDSNPGTISYSLGGVGRNIAHNLRLLGENVQLLTAFGSDDWAERIEKSCETLGIGLDRALRIEGARTSSYLCVTGPDGDLAVGLSDTDVAKYITPAAIEDNLDLLNAAALVVFDGNLTQETMDCLTGKCTAPLFADPVSITKGRKLLPFLGRIHSLKPNALEARDLTGEKDPVDAARSLVALGVKRAFVSDGANGMAVADKTCALRVPGVKADVVNASGGGDAAMAGVCRSFAEGRGLVEGARYALAAGAISTECEETINPALSDEAVLRRLGLV